METPMDENFPYVNVGDVFITNNQLHTVTSKGVNGFEFSVEGSCHNQHTKGWMSYHYYMRKSLQFSFIKVNGRRVI